MGAQQAPEKPTPACLSFIISNQKVNVVLTKSDSLTQSAIIESIVELTSLRATSDQLYLAAPRLLGVTMDTAIFRSYGIGLILYDERRIDEAIPPQIIQPTQPPSVRSSPDPSTIAQLTELKSMLFQMKDTIAKLREEMKTLQEVPKGPSLPPTEIQHQADLHEEPLLSQNTGQLPSFFTNNPWLDVLSRRGREQGEPFAG
jgi:hypothetical protein